MTTIWTRADHPGPSHLLQVGGLLQDEGAGGGEDAMGGQDVDLPGGRGGQGALPPGPLLLQHLQGQPDGRPRVHHVVHHDTVKPRHIPGNLR